MILVSFVLTKVLTHQDKLTRKLHLYSPVHVYMKESLGAIALWVEDKMAAVVSPEIVDPVLLFCDTFSHPENEVT